MLHYNKLFRNDNIHGVCTIKTKNRLIKLINKFCLLLIFFATMLKTTYASSYSSVEEFVAKQTTIRIFIDNAPGFGDQTASQNVMHRLRQLGFNGKFEVIYGLATKDKMIILFNLPKNVPADYYDSRENIRFMTIKTHITRVLDHSIEVVPLGITGANDSSECYLAEEEGVYLDDDEPLCTNTANFMATKVFIEMDPYVENPPLNDHRTTFFTYNPTVPGTYPFPSQEDSYKKFWVFPYANLAKSNDYLANNPDGQRLMVEKPALGAFITGMEQQQYNVMPVYGHLIQLYPYYFPANILQLITGARYAQLYGGVSYHKPLILAIFYDYTQELEVLLKIIPSENWGEYEFPGANEARAVIKKLGLRDDYIIADINKPETIQKIRDLKDRQIMLLSLGPLPKIVFDGIYNYTADNIFPAIREGANSFNTLAMTGKPHFRCLPNWEVGYDLVVDLNLKFRMKEFYKPTGICHDKQTWQKNPGIYQTLGEFILEAHNPQSPLSIYFERLKTEILNPANDRIYYALQGAIKETNKS